MSSAGRGKIQTDGDGRQAASRRHGLHASRARDGARPAYQVFGDGVIPHDDAGSGVAPRARWDFPVQTQFLAAGQLTARGGVTNQRGCGVSDRNLGHDDDWFAQAAADLIAVMDAAELDRTTLYGESTVGPLASTRRWSIPTASPTSCSWVRLTLDAGTGLSRRDARGGHGADARCCDRSVGNRAHNESSHRCSPPTIVSRKLLPVPVRERRPVRSVTSMHAVGAPGRPTCSAAVGADADPAPAGRSNGPRGTRPVPRRPDPPHAVPGVPGKGPPPGRRMIDEPVSR